MTATAQPHAAGAPDAFDQRVWNSLREVETLRVAVLVDNEVDGASSPCASCDPGSASSTAAFTSEFGALTQVGQGGKGLLLRCEWWAARSVCWLHNTQPRCPPLPQAFLEGRTDEVDMSKTLMAGHGLSLLLTLEVRGCTAVFTPALRAPAAQYPAPRRTRYQDGSCMTHI
jgi:hypothetical protein